MESAWSKSGSHSRLTETETGDAVQRHGRTVVLGLGNTILRDDAVGILASRALAARLRGEPVHFSELSRAGFNILDELAGFDWAILIDAMVTGRCAPGTITDWAVPEHCHSPRMISFHDMGFFTALECGRMLGLHMPKRITLFTVEALDTDTVSEEMTPPVAASLEPLIEAVHETLMRGGALRGSHALATLAGAAI